MKQILNIRLNKIKEKRKELLQLEDEYIENTPPCCNKKCEYWGGDIEVVVNVA